MVPMRLAIYLFLTSLASAAQPSMRAYPGRRPLNVDQGRSSGSRLSRAAPAELSYHTPASKSHRLAVLVPYRGRDDALVKMIPITKQCLHAQAISFDIFVLQQTDSHKFNHAALLNAGVKVLEGSSYDYFAFHDADTVCNVSAEPPIRYEYPSGDAPLHLTPPGMHPKYSYDEFFGGNTIFTREQFLKVNGFSNLFWGWGREDDNMQMRLQAHGMWPPERPPNPVPGHWNYYWMHFDHPQPAKPLTEPSFLSDFATGYNDTSFRVERIRPHLGATFITVELLCDLALTPWCED